LWQPLQGARPGGDTRGMKAYVTQQPRIEDLVAQLQSFDGKVYDGTEWQPLALAFTETLLGAYGMIVEVGSTYVASVVADDIIGRHGEVPPPPPPFPNGQVKKVVLSTVLYGKPIAGLFETQELMTLVADPDGAITGLIAPKSAVATIDELVELDNWFSWGAVRLDALLSEKPDHLAVECRIPSHYRFL